MCWLTSAGTMVLHHPFDLGIYLKQIATERPSLSDRAARGAQHAAAE